MPSERVSEGEAGMEKEVKRKSSFAFCFKLASSSVETARSLFVYLRHLLNHI